MHRKWPRAAWIGRLRGWRLAFSVIAIYGLVLQALLNGAAASAAVPANGNALEVICNGDVTRGPTGPAKHAHDQSCSCQGLCAHHSGPGLGLVASAAWSTSLPSDVRLIGLQANPILPRRAAGWLRYARAPPASASLIL